MRTRHACVVCGSKALDAYPAVLSPFVAERLGRPPTACCLVECRDCSHRFFDAALDDGEMQRLYSGYRDPEYVRVRNRWEPWYTEQVNAAIGNDPAEIASRTQAVGDYLRRWVPAEVLAGRVLDYGGDRGQFIPPAVGATKYLYDLSGHPPVDGVVRVRDASALKDLAFDLVLASHVLEHVAAPEEFLSRLQRELGSRSEGHWLYVEVPLERHRILKRRVHPKRIGRAEAGPAVHRRLPWLVRDFYTTALRVKLDLVPPLGVIKLHEHASFFSERSLRTLLARAGYAVVDGTVGSSSGAAGITRVLRAVARHEARGGRASS
jgi:hypothetical protein